MDASDRALWDMKVRRELEEEARRQKQLGNGKEKDEELEKRRKQQEALERKNKQSLQLIEAMKEKTDKAAEEWEAAQKELQQQKKRELAEKRQQEAAQKAELELQAKQAKEAKELEEKRKLENLQAEKNRKAERLQEKVREQKEAEFLAEQRWLKHQVTSNQLVITRNSKGVWVSVPPAQQKEADSFGTAINIETHMSLIKEIYGNIQVSNPVEPSASDAAPKKVKIRVNDTRWMAVRETATKNEPSSQPSPSASAGDTSVEDTADQSSPKTSAKLSANVSSTVSLLSLVSKQALFSAKQALEQIKTNALAAAASSQAPVDVKPVPRKFNSLTLHERESSSSAAAPGEDVEQEHVSEEEIEEEPEEDVFVQ